MKDEALMVFYTDDDKEDREFFKAAVREVGTEVDLEMQSSGDELMKVLRNPPPSPHVLFLDLNMPGKNGFEVLKEIRETEAICDIPIVIFSTSDDRNTIETTKLLGATMYIPKPASYSNLKKVIRHSLSIDWTKYRPGPEEFIYRIN